MEGNNVRHKKLVVVKCAERKSCQWHNRKYFKKGYEGLKKPTRNYTPFPGFP